MKTATITFKLNASDNCNLQESWLWPGLWGKEEKCKSSRGVNSSVKWWEGTKVMKEKEKI